MSAHFNAAYLAANRARIAELERRMRTTEQRAERKRRIAKSNAE